MAKNTNKLYRSQVIYSVYVRNHTLEGTFEGLRQDLPRIKALGTDIVWLMPIHPIGKKARKGSLGSPYAIRDYLSVNPEYGTLDDFRRLVDEIHRLNMKCILDVVYHHTSPDSVLAVEHPEWFFHKADGSFGNKVGDWTDVIDLDYTNRALWDYLIDVLKYWASMVDGFRCDVAPLIPLAFWQEARAQVETVRAGCLWLAETVDPPFIAHLRSLGFDCLSDSQAYEAFDVCYDYDTYHLFRGYLEGTLPLERYVRAVNQQEVIYPSNYIKLRYLENHDQLRAGLLIPNEKALRNWTAFLFFQKGTTLLYGGQEAGCTHLPSLFDKDPVDWSGPDLTPLFQRLSTLKRHPLFLDSTYQIDILPGDLLRAVHHQGNRRLVGVFSVTGANALATVDVPDGRYKNWIDGESVAIQRGGFKFCGDPIIFEADC